MKIQFNGRYFIWAIALFLVEVFIALYVTDAFVRPYVGDFLVVILLYCLIASVLTANRTYIALAVLAFAYTLETMQYFKIVEILGLDHYPLANVVIGTSFAWFDLVAYTLGIIFVLLVDRKK